MALREIGARLTLDGEAEWNSQMKAAERNLKNVKSELVANQAEFAGMANTTEALTSKQKLLQTQFAQQKEKIRALEKALEDLEEAGEGSSQKADKLRDSLNYAKAAASKTQGEIKDLDKYLQEAEDSADGCATSIDEFGKATKDAGDKADGLIDVLGELVPGLDKIAGSGKLTAAAIGIGVVGAAKSAVNWMMNLVDETEELRTSMAKLEAAADNAGAAMDDDLNESLIDLYVAADKDWDSAFEAMSNLLNAGYDETLPEIINQLSGAVIAFPDTLKIESLADSLQETIATGQATGQFAELLERLGIDLDTFNAKLGEAGGQMEAQNIVAQTLAQTGLSEINAAYQENNEEMIALSEAEANLQLAQANLAESFVPLKTWLTNTAASALNLGANWLEAQNHGMALNDALKVLRQSNKDAADAGFDTGVSFEELFSIMDEGGLSFDDLKQKASDNKMTMGEYVNTLRDTESGEEGAAGAAGTLAGSFPAVASNAQSATYALDNYTAAAYRAAAAGSVSAAPVSGSHAAGLDYVPYNGYVAELHRGEMVLTAGQASAVRDGGGGMNADAVAAAVRAGMAGMGVYIGKDALIGEIIDGVDEGLGAISVGAARNG